MKKNVMMRVASIMLVLVLMSSSVISGTFAKYVTATTTNDSARVARWGVEFVTESDLFATEYKYDVTQNGVAGIYSVESKAGGNVVAPGTKGEGYNFYTTGDPEVSYKVTFDVEDASAETIYLDNYFPVVFELTIGGVAHATGDGSIGALISAIEECCYMYDVDEEKYYISGNGGVNWVEYTGVGAPELDLTWYWLFEQGKDVEDTTLGYIAYGKTVEEAKALTSYAGTGDYNLEIAFTVTATATQID